MDPCGMFPVFGLECLTQFREVFMRTQCAVIQLPPRPGNPKQEALNTFLR
jgi:hypothetical protein